ncbi:MAG: HesA/MoeB/ThiF family protein [Wolinella succinogenes]|uniref:HesA/MoeB/ThiF family protein n=1 Tax=Wolinella succinogenes TaxID=844 RepID=UPI00169892AC|nr:HesA/MoeB/ThiF family protein [Wolinella succinogenes]NLU33664.1 HesA/MoeB/ThiF family protein [Wolinella succinogenes]
MSGLNERYLRNHATLSLEDQAHLGERRVMIIGCGGLGGYVAENLTRLGVGKLDLVDPDEFAIHNLNRQRFSNTQTLHQNKAQCAALALEVINPEAKLTPLEVGLEEIEETRFKEVDLLVDALDNSASRRYLQKIAVAYQKPLVHGAIGGLGMQYGLNVPLEKLYAEDSFGAEKREGNLSFVASGCAAMMSYLAMISLLGRAQAHEGILYRFDWCDMEITPLSF